jgi:threonine dehydrogenase-like Zn-dependent dehydrogenase
MRAALGMLADGMVDPEPLITHQLPLDETARALELQRSGSALKVVVIP